MLDRSHIKRSDIPAICVLLLAVLISGCSLPNLESQPCREARDSVRQFYSWYLGTPAADRDNQPEIFRRLVSSDFTSDAGQDVDRFFLDARPPTTFKVGSCKQQNDQQVDMQVQVYWRDEPKVVQNEVHVEVVKGSAAWLIRKVSR